MIHGWETISTIPQNAILANMIMSQDKEPNTKGTIKKDWSAGAAGKSTDALFTSDELDIYVNKITLEAYIFHNKELDYDNLDRLEYDQKDYSVDVVKKDGTRINLGVKIQWLIRPYFTKAQEINIVQTKNGESINGVVIPLKHKEK